MGRQQLLLLVLSSIIVGLAVLAGIQAFDQKQVQANQDALIQDAVRLFADAKGAVARPSHMGGVADFTGVTLSALNRETTTASCEGCVTRDFTNQSCDLKIPKGWPVISSIVEKSPRSGLLPSGRLLDSARSDLLREF